MNNKTVKKYNVGVPKNVAQRVGSSKVYIDTFTTVVVRRSA